MNPLRLRLGVGVGLAAGGCGTGRGGAAGGGVDAQFHSLPGAEVEGGEVDAVGRVGLGVTQDGHKSAVAGCEEDGFLEQATEGAVRHGELLHSFEGFMIYPAKLQPPHCQNGAIMPISDVKSAIPPE